MNNDIIVITKKIEEIKRFETIAKLLKLKIFFAENLNQLCNMLEKFIPLVVIIVEDEDPPSELYFKEIKRIAPLLCVIIAMKEKNSEKKKKYEKVFDGVLNYPWTEVELKNIINSILSIKLHPLKTEKNKIKINYILIPLITFIAIIFLTILLPSNKKQPLDKNNIKKIQIPSKNISGFFETGKRKYIYDWVIQAFYIYNENNELETIKNLPTKEIITILKDGETGNFFTVSDEGEVIKRNKDESFSIVSRVKYLLKIEDLCYDGMYVWILTKGNLIKTLNNSELTTISTYSLPEENVKYLGCSSDEIYLYSPSKIYNTSTYEPNLIKTTLQSPSKKVIHFDYKNGKIIYIYEEDKKAYLEYIEKLK